MKSSLLVVNYRSSGLTRDAVSTARSATSEELEVVVVDNSCDANEAERVHQLGADQVLVSPDNLGYGAGVNSALEYCSGEVVIVTNPDVVFEPGSIDRLLEPLRQPEVGLTGPAFFWDQDLQWHLPPSETMSFGQQLLRNLFPSSLSRRRLRERVELWKAKEPIDRPVLSGAVMAMRTDDLRRLRFDERFRLYFEEVDLMRRLRSEGRSVRLVPRARVRHLWSQSALRNPESQRMFEESRQEFDRKWFGRLGSFILNRTRRPSPNDQSGNSPTADLTFRTAGDRELLIEIGDTRHFLMAAGRFAREAEVTVAEEMLLTSPLDRLHARVIDPVTLRTLDRRVVKVK